MIYVDGTGIITMNRGDTFRVPLYIDKSNDMFKPERYFLTDLDKVYFGVVEANHPFEESIIRKTYTVKDTNDDGDVIIKFDTTDTEYLLPGTYFYEIKLYRVVEPEESGEEPTEPEEQVITIVPRRKFVILD